MQPRLLVILAGLAGLLALNQSATAAADLPIVTFEPPCPEWQMPTAAGQPMVAPTITIRYDGRSPGARLKSSQAISLVLASAAFSRYELSTIPMRRSEDGIWQATYILKKNNVAAYAIFFFRDTAGRIDNHGNQYWDILNCERSAVSPYAVEMQASSYKGGLLAPGIQRPPDLARAIEIVRTDLDARPAAAMHYPFLWDLELQQGKNSPAAFEQLGKDVNAFLDARATDLYAMRQTMSFVAAHQQRLPANVVERFRTALIALPEKADPYEINAVTKEVLPIPRTARFMAAAQQDTMRGLAELDYWSIDPNDQDKRRKAADYLAFAQKYPNSSRTIGAYQSALCSEAEIHDLLAAESIFTKWAAADPSDPFPFIEMAQVYIDQKTKPARAVGLLDAAEQLYAESERPSSHHHFHREPGKLESLRARVPTLC